MTSLFPLLRRGTAWILGCVLASLWFLLPAYALPADSTAYADPNPNRQTTAMYSEGEETLQEGFPVTEGTDRPTEQDPHHALAPTSTGNRWMVIALCVLTVISVVLIIVAMSPRKKK